jgi:hypothetical protein
MNESTQDTFDKAPVQFQEHIAEECEPRQVEWSWKDLAPCFKNGLDSPTNVGCISNHSAQSGHNLKEEAQDEV